MFEIKTVLDSSVQKELSSTDKVISAVLITTGLLGLLSFIILDIILTSSFFWFSLISSVPFAIGLVRMIVINSNIKTLNNQTDFIENFYEFHQDFFHVSSSKNGDNIGTAKIYYKDIIRCKETDNFFYLYIGKASAYAISKSILKDEQKSFVIDTVCKK